MAIIRYRQCKKSDLGDLVELARETYVTAFEAVNDPNDFKTYIDRAFHPATLERELDTPGSSFHFILEGGRPIGYFKLNTGPAQSEPQDPGALELERIYVLAEQQGRGIGTQVLGEVIRMAREGKREYLWLGVWEHNQGAIDFYSRHNFQKFGEHPYYIGRDRQTDWLMRLEL